MTDEAEAARILLPLYMRIGPDRQPREVSGCAVKFTAVPKRERRGCFYTVKDSVLNVDMRDVSVDAGVLTVTSRFVTEQMGHDRSRKIRLWFVPRVVAWVLALLGVMSVLISMLYGYGDVGPELGIVEMVVVAALFAWGNQLGRFAEGVFVERLMKATSLDERSVRDIYWDHIRRRVTKGEVMAFEGFLVVIVLMAWFMSVLMGGPGFFTLF